MTRFNSGTLQAGALLVGLALLGAGCFDSATNPVGEGTIVYKDGIKPPPPPPPTPPVPPADPCAAGIAATGAGPFNAVMSGVTKKFDPVKPRLVLNTTGDALAPAPSLETLQSCAMAVPAGTTITGTANVLANGKSVTTTGGALSFTLAPNPLEAGTMLGTDALGNTMLLAFGVPTVACPVVIPSVKVTLNGFNVAVARDRAPLTVTWTL